MDEKQESTLQKLDPAKRTAAVDAQVVGDAVGMEAVAAHEGVPPAVAPVSFVETDGTLPWGVDGVKLRSGEKSGLETQEAHNKSIALIVEICWADVTLIHRAQSIVDQSFQLPSHRDWLPKMIRGTVQKVINTPAKTTLRFTGTKQRAHRAVTKQPPNLAPERLGFAQ